MTSQKKRSGFDHERYIKFPIKNFPDYLHNPLVEESFVSEIGYFPQAENHFCERLDGADEFIILYCLKGEGRIHLEGDTPIILQENELFCIPKRMPHVYFSSEVSPWSIIWLHFDTSLVRELPLKSKEKIKINSPQKRSLVDNLFLDLLGTEILTYSLKSSIYISHLLTHLLTTIYFYEDSGEESTTSYLLTNCIRYLSEQLTSDVTLPELCQKFNVSASYLNAIFMEETSKSPIDFFIHLKMEEACRLLRLTTRRISDIANELGYKDQYYFSRLFKKKIGVSPRNYRSNYSRKESALEKIKL